MQNNNLWAKLGPGLLFAGAAIGISHTVQSTRAGAIYGLGLLVVILLANIVKYPTFRFGPHFAAVTGMSLPESYARQGKWIAVLLGLALFTIQSIIVAAVAITTSGIANAAFGLSLPAIPAAVGIIAVTLVLIYSGGYRLAERVTKVCVVIVTVATLLSTLIILPRIPWSFWPAGAPGFDAAAFLFLVALVGMMPAGPDLSAMHSLWTKARGRAGEGIALKDVTLDFNIGYIGTTIMAVCFLLMGAGVLFAAGEAPVDGAAAFGGQVVSLYSAALGPAVGAVVGVALFMVIFSTLLAILDGFPRVTACFYLAIRSPDGRVEQTLDRSLPLAVVMALLGLGAIYILLNLMGSFSQFIDFTSVVTFLSAPFFALLNHRAVFGPDVAEADRPSRLLRNWSLLSIVFLFLLAALFFWVRLSS